MKGNISRSKELLQRTPKILNALLYNIDAPLGLSNEGGDTWTPFDVVGHLIYCERYNWIPRIEVVLSELTVRKFEPIDRFAQLHLNKGKTLNQLLNEFEENRDLSLHKLEHLNITPEQLNETASHPDLGIVTLSQLISTWVVHDLTHLNQISRTIAKQYDIEVGPWKSYLSILK